MNSASDIPETWITHCLDGCLALNQSGTWGNNPKDKDSDMPVLRSTNIQNGNLVLKDVAMRVVAAKDVERYALDNGDIIVTKSSGSPHLLGKNAIFSQPDDGQTYLFANFVQRLRTNPDILLAQFLYYYLNSPFAAAFLERMQSTTSGLRNLNMGMYAAQKIPLPPLPEQERIVEILRAADELRQLRAQANQRAQDLLPALFHEMFGDLSPASNYPGTWEITPLRNLIEDTQYGISHSLTSDKAGNVPVLRMNNITLDGQLDLTDLKYLSPESVDFDKYDLRAGDLVFNRTNSVEQVGKTGLWQCSDDEQYTFASYLIRVRVGSKILPEYLWSVLNSNYGKTRMRRLAKQAVNMANINTNELGSIPVLVPPLLDQEKFRAASFQILNQLAQQDHALDRYEDLLASLISRAFTGELTADWRAAHHDELVQAARERDEILGRKPATPASTPKAEQPPSPTVQPKRAMHATLDRHTAALLAAAEAHPAYFRPEELAEACDLNRVQIESSLHVLAALGFVRQVQIDGQRLWRLVDAVGETVDTPQELTQ